MVNIGFDFILKRITYTSETSESYKTIQLIERFYAIPRADDSTALAA